MSIKFLTQEEAIKMDEELMGTLGFSTDQLMELAGLACASAVYRTYPVDKFRNVVIVCGPGNNGGDGMVCARHLKLFGYSPFVFYPKRTDRPLYKNLVTLLHTFEIPLLESLPEPLSSRFQLVVDAIFGYSFKGDIRAPFDSIIRTLNGSTLPIASLDIPSGWDVTLGNHSGLGLNAHMLVSLTAPKLCAQHFRGIHYLGGRFVPPVIARKYGLHELPPYRGDDQVVLLSKPT